MDRRLWLIDAGYLFNARHSVSQGFVFDYLRLRNKLEELGEIWRAYYLNSSDRSSDQQDGFHAWLQSAPPAGPKIVVKLYDLKDAKPDRAYCLDCRQMADVRCVAGAGHRLQKKVQKGVDVGLATLALTLQSDYDTLVLSSGDGDLLDAVEYLTEHGGKRIELAVFNMGVSTDLQARADNIHWLDNWAQDIEKSDR